MAFPAQHDGRGWAAGLTGGPVVVASQVAPPTAAPAGPHPQARMPAADVVFPWLEGVRGAHGVLMARADRVGADPGDRVRPAGDAGLAGGEGGIADALVPEGAFFRRATPSFS
jgi:hypothetical protein